jgi:fermentation-respiration switch protein FrsA (DUF1100 family)
VQRIIYFVLIVFGISVTLLFVLTGSLASPRMHIVGEPPKGFNVEQVIIEASGGHTIAGWFVEGEPEKAGILLLHSVRSDRTEMIGRGKFLLKAGYSVLLIDMQAHGETHGKNITFGVKESEDAHAALDFLRRRVHRGKVGVIGISLGGAAALLGKSPIEADAVILEGVYSSIEKAVENRIAMRLGSLGAYLAPLLTWQIEVRLDIPIEDLSPVKAISILGSPVFIVAGSDDKRTVIAESRLLFERANDPKELWIIEGAKHQDFHKFAGKEYEKQVRRFFQKYL